MANKASITARIPEDLLDQVEARVEQTGKSKTEVLTEALTAYLRGDVASARDMATLTQEMHAFQTWAYNHIGSLETRLFSLENSLRPTAENMGSLPDSARNRDNGFPRLLAGGEDYPTV